MNTLQAQQDIFEKKVFTEDSKSLPYRFVKPLNYTENNEEKYPLILFLHGAGERGNDNELQLTYVDTVFGKEWFRNKYPSFVVLPQCPLEKRWVEVDWKLPTHKQPEHMSEQLQLVMKIIESVTKEFNVDTTRIYVIGLSMGGFGTWDLISRFPNKFAAAIPICGGADVSTACKIKNMPVWAFHGAKDKVVMVDRSRKMIEAMQKCGATPKYTEYKNSGHLIWNKVFANKKVWEWLFNQKIKNN